VTLLHELPTLPEACGGLDLVFPEVVDNDETIRGLHQQYSALSI
jgi:hypothetical protein